ncbi:hypothetical protein B296_00005285 [Ensete ventricosum]|uniref:Uncharacterized protein n=1 Tax=Ensete ventricosum TaxID=4639 RepID=A0A426YZL3_ENSVE|nr:hypothetical protein B296_00005285 [Ensete ventricosum]
MGSCVQSRVSINFSLSVSKIQNTGHSRHISPWEVVRARFSKKTRRSYTMRESRAGSRFDRFFMHLARRVEFRSIFRAPSRKFKILAIPNVIAHGKSYELGFTKKLDGHILCPKSCTELSFDRFFVHCLRNSKYWPFPTVEFRSIFRAPSWKFKILPIPDVLAYEKTYEHGFAKELDGHILHANRAQSRVSIDFSCTVPKIQNIGHSQRNSP